MTDHRKDYSLQTPTDTSDGARSRVNLLQAYYAEIARYAVQLAADRVATVVENASIHGTCTICLNVGDPNKPVRHDESCLVGRIFALTTEIARLHVGPS